MENENTPNEDDVTATDNATVDPGDAGTDSASEQDNRDSDAAEPEEKLTDQFYDEDELRAYIRRGGTYKDFFKQKDREIYSVNGRPVRVPPSVIFAGIAIVVVVIGFFIFFHH